MAENIYGTQIYRDLSRYNPNNTGKKHNEAPFEQIRVGPGLGQGYTNLPSGGKHETLRIMPKPVDQLRVDPVTETEAKTASGASLIAKRGMISQLFRNRQELLVTNENGERNFTTTGASIAPMAQPTVVLRNTRRKKSRTMQGAARASVNSQVVAPASRESSRINFQNTPFRNMAAQEQMVSDYGRQGYHAYDNNRMSVVPQGGGGDGAEKMVFGGTQTIMQLLGLSARTQSGHTVKVQDKAKQTRKQFYEANPRSMTGNANSAGQMPARGPSYNPKEWIAKKTIRETTGDTNHVGQASGIQKKHIVYSGQHARKTIRETTGDTNHVGHASGIQKKHIVYSGQKARKTIRETTGDTNHIGQASGSQKKHKAGPQDHARKTIRETTEDNKYIGAANSYSRKAKSYDSAYNARTNVNKEVVSQGRAPTNRGPNLGHQEINMEVKKIDEDRLNRYSAVKTSSLGNTFNPQAICADTVTSEKNHLPQLDTRMDVSILDAYKRNPLAQSLSSWF
jgi:hypothetical protein